MQLRFSFLILFFLIISCKSIDYNEEEIKVIGTIYKAIPKVIPPPPPVKGDINSEIRNPVDFLKHRYAIFQEFINIKPTNNVANVFYEYKSNELFKEISIDSVSIGLVRYLGKLDSNENFNKEELNKFVNKDLIYLNQRYVQREEKNNLNINGIISFSRVAFNKGYDKAAVCVGIHYDKLATSQVIYILEKVNGLWKIKFTEVVDVS